jgi:large subunit ribosomal protein L23
MDNIIIKPILTEKMADLGEKLNRYAFEVKNDANKIQIKKAIESAYGVNVKAVNTMKHGGGKRNM